MTAGRFGAFVTFSASALAPCPAQAVDSGISATRVVGEITHPAARQIVNGGHGGPDWVSGWSDPGREDQPE